MIKTDTTTTKTLVSNIAKVCTNASEVYRIIELLTRTLKKRP